MSEQIKKILSNVAQSLTSTEQAQARANIDAVSSTELTNGLAAKQDTLTAGPNVDIINNVISTEKPRVSAGTNVSVSSSIDNVNRTVTYTVSATDTTYSAGSGLSLNGTTFSNSAPNVKSDWNAAAGSDAEILNKPTIPSKTSQLDNDSGFVTSSQVPAAQVNADWNSTSGVSEVLNKPSIPEIDLGSSTSQGPVLTRQDSLSVWPANLRVATSTGSTMTFEAWMAPDPTGNGGKFLGVDSNGDIAWTPKVMRFDTPKTPQIQYNSATEVPWTIMGGAATLYLEFAARPDPADVNSWSAMTLQLATANSKPFYVTSRLMQEGDYSVYTGYGASDTGAKADLGQLIDGVQPSFTARNETERIELDIYVGDGVYQDDDHWRKAKVTITRVAMPSTSSTTPPRLFCTCEYEGK